MHTSRLSKVRGVNGARVGQAERGKRNVGRLVVYMFFCVGHLLRLGGGERLGCVRVLRSSSLFVC